MLYNSTAIKSILHIHKYIDKDFSLVKVSQSFTLFDRATSLLSHKACIRMLVVPNFYLYKCFLIS